MLLAKILTFFFAAIMLLGAYYPRGQSPISINPSSLPSFPLNVANILSTIAEAAIGIALLVPSLRKWGALGFLLLMIAFLPLHTWDLFREKPAMGSQTAAIIRFVIQLVVIYGGWWLYGQYK